MSDSKFFCVILIFTLAACIQPDIPRSAEENVMPINPQLDSLSIAGIYKSIFTKSCSVNGCHDGSFEPNLTSIQSSYQTLVYHPIVKNNKQEEFKYRVVPHDTASSVLYQRITRCCFVNDDDRMPQHTDKQLESYQIATIATWIMNGAKDMEGKTPLEPVIN